MFRGKRQCSGGRCWGEEEGCCRAWIRWGSGSRGGEEGVVCGRMRRRHPAPARSFFVSVIQQHSEISRVQTDKLKIRLERKDDCKDKKGGTLGSVDAFLRVSLRQAFFVHFRKNSASKKLK